MLLVNKSFRNIISPISFLSRNFLNLWSNKQLGFLLYKHKRLESLYLLQNLIFKLFLAFIILFILFLARKSRYNGLDAKTSNWYFFKIFPKYSSNWFFFFWYSNNIIFCNCQISSSEYQLWCICCFFSFGYSLHAFNHTFWPIYS